jgi:integrase
VEAVSSGMNKRHRVLIAFRFSEEVLEEPIANEPFASAPTVFLLDTFLEWFADSRTSNLEEVITDTTIRNRLAQLKKVIKLFTNYKYSDAQNEQLQKTVSRLIKSNKLTTAGNAKPIATVDVSRDLVRFLWACDKYQHPHPRWALQLAFLITIYTDLGTRPGEVLESDAWIGTNEGLQYGDIILKRYHMSEMKGQYVIVVKRRNRKGHRSNKKNSYV